MSFDFTTLTLLRQNHPAWRLLHSDNAPLLASFLQRVFITPNVRAMAQSDLAEMLEDELFALRQQHGKEAFPRMPLDYLNDWASQGKGWLRKFYRDGSDEPQFDLTPATEKAISWLGTLVERSFVGTESRLLTLFELLKQISAGTETDPQVRIAELQRRRDEIDAEIDAVRNGDMKLLDDTAIRDRFQQFTQLARDLLTDFREVEQNFRTLDRHVRERIALWNGAKGALLKEIMGERDAIADSDQGRSFRAFWDFLMSGDRQAELSTLLERVLTLPPVSDLKPDGRLRRVHYDWLEAGEITQRTVAQLSHQLRRFLDDQAWLENRRIMDILHGIEAKALALRASPPPGEIMQIADTTIAIELPMERPLYKAAIKPIITDFALDQEDSAIDSTALYTQVVIDKARLARHIRQALQDRSQISLGELCAINPLQNGLAELVAYLQLAGGGFKAVLDDACNETILWQGAGPDGRIQAKQARLPRIIYVR